MGVANFAKVLELQVNNKVIWYDTSLVLAHVFGREFHLACVDVISVLDKGSVEHDSE